MPDTKKLAKGSVLLTTNNTASGEWIRQPEVLAALDQQLGTTSQANCFYIMVENAPFSLEVDNAAEARQLEFSNDLPRNAIRTIWWVKPERFCRPGQQNGHIQIGLQSRADANKLIRNRVLLAGLSLRARKVTHLPHKCNKCSEFGKHQAKDCKAKNNVCSRCSQDHRTSECTVNEQSSFQCPNCHQQGHKAADPNCPVYTQQIKDLRRRFPADNYVLFPTDRPDTWTRHEVTEHNGPPSRTPTETDYNNHLHPTEQRINLRHTRRPPPPPPQPTNPWLINKQAGGSNTNTNTNTPRNTQPLRQQTLHQAYGGRANGTQPPNNNDETHTQRTPSEAQLQHHNNDSNNA